MSGRGFRARAARLLCAACALLAFAARPATPQPRRRPRPTPPSSTRRRRSLRCPTSASTGPTSMRRTQAACRPPPSPAAQPTTRSRRDGGEHSLHGRTIEGLAADRRCRGAAEGVPPAVRARGRPQGPGQRRADRPPLARRRRSARRSCCAARAITTRTSSRAPNAAGDSAARRPRRRSRASNIASPRSSFRGSTRPVRTPRSCATPSR